MDPIILNKALKAKKLDKFLELFPEEEKLDQLNRWREEEIRDDEAVVPKNGEILICGYPALAGTVLLAKYYEEELNTYFPMHFMHQTLKWEKTVEQDIRALKEKSSSLRDAYVCFLGEGGLNKAMYQLGKDSGIGFTIYHEEIPVRQESIEICEYFDLDPWSLFSAGSMLIVSDRSRAVMEEMKAAGILCCRVGYMTEGKDKFISHKTINSRVNRPSPDGLLQIMQEKIQKA